MDSSATPIIKFIRNVDRTFMIPVYQRNYSWSIDNCDQLFEDLLRAENDNKNHYFGNIVYYVTNYDTIHNYEELALIDGQQRITTIMLLIAAIRDNCKEKDDKDSITRNYLQNKDSEERERVKLKQIEGDRDSYEAIIAGKEPENKECNAYKNYAYFKNLVKKSEKTPAELLEALNRLIVVAIDLKLKQEGSLSEKPQIIFESINATGKKLSDADLLRNFILLDIPDNEQETYYKDYWLLIERNIPSADGMTDFINRYLIMRLKNDVAKNTEYKTFKRNYDTLFYADSSKERAEKALKDLLHFSKYYGWIKNPTTTPNKDLEKALASINEAKSDYAAPLFLLLVERSENEKYPNFNTSDLIDTLDIIESWLFRARIVKDISTGLIGQIARSSLLSVVTKADNNANYKDVIMDELSNYRIRDVWPKDEEFKSAFVKYDFYHSYKNYVQKKLEKEISKDHDEINVDPHSIEHVLPQTLTQYWKDVLGENYAQLHAEYLNTIGNLAPMNKSDNSINSNGDYGMKREQLSKSAWRLTQEIPVKYEKWGIEEIQRRAAELADEAVRIWRGPNQRTRDIEANTMDTEGRDLSIVPFGDKFVLNEPSLNTFASFEIVERKNGKRGFELLAGSRINVAIKDNHVWRREGKEELLVRDGDSFVVKENILFDTPSAAAAFCVGRNINGWTAMKDVDGQTLDQRAREI